MGVGHDIQIYTHTIYRFLLVLQFDLQEGQLAPDSHVGNSSNEATTYIKVQYIERSALPVSSSMSA
jgi:hypothetical protein